MKKIQININNIKKQFIVSSCNNWNKPKMSKMMDTHTTGVVWGHQHVILVTTANTEFLQHAEWF